MMTNTEMVYFGTALLASIVGVIMLVKSTRKPAAQYPRPLETFFEAGCCPQCGNSTGFFSWQDGGHDVVLECPSCQSVYGVNWPPLSTIEQIGGRVEKMKDEDQEDDFRAVR